MMRIPLLILTLVASVSSQATNTSLFVSILSLFVLVSDAFASDTHVEPPLASPQDGVDVSCRVIAVDMEGDVSEGNTRDESFRCLTKDNISYSLDLPNDFVDQHSHIAMGDLHISVPSHAIRENQDGSLVIVVSNSTEISIPSTRRLGGRRRRLSIQERRKGIKSLLVLRVNGADSRITLSQQDLSKRIFGIGDNAPTVNVRSQFNACSFGKFRIVPATGTGITDGVASVTIGNVKNKDPFNLEHQVVSVAEKKLGINDLEDKFDHVMICLPPGTLYNGVRERWFAYGYLNWVSCLRGCCCWLHYREPRLILISVNATHTPVSNCL